MYGTPHILRNNWGVSNVAYDPGYAKIQLIVLIISTLNLLTKEYWFCLLLDIVVFPAVILRLLTVITAESRENHIAINGNPDVT
jgi:hypothetical protein